MADAATQLPGINQGDLTGDCYRLNRNFDLLGQQIAAIQQQVVNGIPGSNGVPGPPGPPNTSCQVSYNSPPADTLYPGSIVRNSNQKFGERISILDFGAVADGVTDNAPAIRLAYLAAVSKGGCDVYMPGSITGQPYIVNTYIAIDATTPVSFTGDGRATVIKRGAAITAGFGVFDLQNASDVLFRNFLVDGDVTVSTGLNYSAITGGDPMITALTQDSAFWVHGGERLEWNGVWIEHTAGYAILLDSRTVDINDVKIFDCSFRNNRQYTFGTSGGDLNYGSWTGGIFYKNDGAVNTTSVTNLFICRCFFERNTGNCVWGHGYGVLAQHQGIKIDGNVFIDCGLDGILHGNTVGGSANDNQFRRIGYICTDDTSPSTPKYLANAFATAIDSTGIVKGVTYNDNSMVSVNGDYVNGDGFGHGQIANNVMIIPAPGTPEYTEDQIAIMGPGGTGCVSQGIVMNNSNNIADVDAYVNISGNVMYNIPGVNIGGYGTRFSYIIGNQLFCPTAMLGGQFPISLGNIGTGAAQRSYTNVVSRNTIWWAPAAAHPCVFEDAGGGAFTAGDTNYCVLNTVISSNGNAYEFKSNVNTSSRSETVFATNDAGVAANSSHSFQRESHGQTSALKIYYYEGATRWQHAQMQGYWSAGNRGPLLNISEAGTGGAFTTGARTSLPFTDIMATGHLYGDGFLALTDSTFTYPNDPSADLLNTNAWGVIRYNSTTHIFEQSVSVSAGHRVWGPFGGGFWTLSGSLLYPSSTAYVVLIGRNTDDGTGGSLQLHGRLSLTGNDVTPFSANIVMDTNVIQGQTSADATIIDNQGFEGNFIRMKSHLDYFDWTNWGTATTPLPAHTLQLRDSANNVLLQYFASGSFSTTGQFAFIGSVSASLQYQFAGVDAMRKSGGVLQWSNDGIAWNNFGANFWTLSGGLLYPTSTGDQVIIGRNTDDGTGGILQLQGRLSLTGNNVAPFAANIIMDTNAGQGQTSGDATIIDNQGIECNFHRIKSHLDYFDWTNWGTGTTPLAANTLQLRDSSNNVIFQYVNPAGSFVFDIFSMTGSLTVSKTCSVSNLNVDTGGVIEWNAQAALRFSGGHVQYSDNGSSWSNILQVSSLTAGTGIGVSGSTGAVTVTNTGVTAATGTASQILVNGNSGSPQTGSITLTTPQDIATGSTVRFLGLLVNQANDLSGFAIQCNGGIEMTATGSNILSKGTNTNAIYANAGGITSHTGFWIEGNQIADSATGNIISYGVFVVNSGGTFTGQTVTVVGVFTIGGTGYTQLFFRGGILVSYA